MIKDSDGTIEGCHETEADADDQMKALYANEESSVAPAAGRTVSGMLWTIRQTATGWDVLHGDDVVASFDGPPEDVKAAAHAYSLAVGYLADAAVDALPAVAPDEGGPEAPPDGVIPQRWQAGPTGICANAETGDGRDFTPTVWTWRASAFPLPVMYLAETEYGHFGAQLAGFIDTQGDPTTGAGVSGWFHDSDVGRAAYNVLSAQGSVGVSVDPGAVTASFVCTEEVVDEWGPFCLDGMTVFEAYEIAGFTIVPFPAFATASIELVPVAEAPAEAEPVPVPTEGPITQVAASGITRHPTVQADLDAFNAAYMDRANAGTLRAAAPVRPPAAWFAMGEPDDDDPRYVDQRDGQMGIPLTISDDGQVYGHFGLWGTCHVGYAGECVTPPVSAGAYAHFHVGVVTADDGSDVATGTLTAGCDHALHTLRAPAARDHYAHNGIAWADVRASNGRHGPWVAGALRPDVTDEQVRVLRAGALSGDWRQLGAGLEAIAILAVSVPGFPIVRDAIAASGFDLADLPSAAQWAVEDGRQVSLVASGVLRPAPTTIDALVAAGTIEPCAECGKRRMMRRSDTTDTTGRLLREMAATLAQVNGRLDILERRTRPQLAVAAAPIRDGIKARLAARNGTTVDA